MLYEGKEILSRVRKLWNFSLVVQSGRLCYRREAMQQCSAIGGEPRDREPEKWTNSIIVIAVVKRPTMINTE
jgi:hypothetical protein